jgi:hypothetical protein
VTATKASVRLLPPRAATRRAVSINVAVPEALSIAPLKMLSLPAEVPLRVPTWSLCAV